MNLMVIGGNSAEKLTGVIKKTFDDVNVLSFVDINIFMQEALLREFEIHRLVLLQDAIDNVSDDNVYEFVDFLSNYYPATRIITISRDKDTTVFLGDLITSPFSVHFFTKSVTSKLVVDIVASDIETLKFNNKNIVYKKETESYTNVVDEESLYKEEKEESEDNQKRSFLSKVFGVGPKKKNKKSMSKKNGLKPIGQGQGVNELSEIEPTIFDKSDNIQDDFEEEITEDVGDYSMFDDDENDVGLGVIPTSSKETEQANEDDFEEEIDEDFEEEEDEDLNFDGFNNNEFLNTDIYKEENFVEEAENETSDFEEEGQMDGYKGFDKGIASAFNLEDLKKDLEQKTIEDISDFSIKRPNKVEIDIEEVNETLLDLGTDFTSIMKDYEEETSKSKVKVVEKVIKVPVKENKLQRNKHGVRVVLVTGDRRTGATKLSINLANSFAKESSRVLLVDFDRYRKGVVSYIGVEEIINEPQPIQLGLKQLRTENMLNNVTYFYPKGNGFNILLSIYGEEIEDEQMLVAQRIIATQKQFDTVVIDCPMENLYLMKNLILTSNILICVEDDRVGITNTIINLNSSVEDEVLPFLFENSSFVVGRGSNIEQFNQEMAYVENIFGMDEVPYNWASLEIIGTIKGTKKLVERLVM